MKKLLFILFLVPFLASATAILPYNPPPSFIGGIVQKIQMCGWNPLCYFEQRLGATITSITGTTLVSSFPTIYNTNNTNLNADKFELSDWYATTSAPHITTLANLATIGTITSGSWNATAIPVNKGGTGTTSPSIYRILLGDATNGVTAASSTGTTGQYFRSNGAGAYPSFQTSAVDEGISYNWTAHHIFTSLFATNASSTNATSTNLYVSGTTNFPDVAKKFYLNTATAALSAGTASTTVFSVSVPANTLSTSNAIKCELYIPLGACSATAKIKFDVSYGGTASSTIMTVCGAGSGNLYTDIKFLLSATGAASTQKLSLYPQIINDTTPQQLGVKESTPNIDSTVARTLFAVVAFATDTGTFPAGQVVCTLIR